MARAAGGDPMQTSVFRDVYVDYHVTESNQYCHHSWWLSSFANVDYSKTTNQPIVNLFVSWLIGYDAKLYELTSQWKLTKPVIILRGPIFWREISLFSYMELIFLKIMKTNSLSFKSLKTRSLGTFFKQFLTH